MAFADVLYHLGIRDQFVKATLASDVNGKKILNDSFVNILFALCVQECS